MVRQMRGSTTRRVSAVGLAWLLLASTLVAAPAFRLTQPLEAATSIRPIPWQVGEHLQYDVRLGMLPAGSQTLRVIDERIQDGTPIYQLQSISSPSSLLSRVYHFADERTSFVRKDDLLPIRYVKDTEDGSYRAHYVVEFDRRDCRASVWKDGDLDREWDVPEHVQDELSMIYLLRSKTLDVGGTYEFSMFTGREIVPVKVNVLSRVYFEAPAPIGKVPVFRLRASNGLVVWITDDEYRIPVRIEADVKIFGSLVATLKGSNGLVNGHTSPDK